MTTDTDVLIVGGGPAGASAALSLLNYTKASVMLVEQSDLDHIRTGEHVSSGIFDLIKYLKLNREDFEDGCFLPTYGSVSYWGGDLPISRDAIFTTERASYQLDREKFDLTLIQKVAEKGGKVFPRTKCMEFSQKENKHWEVSLKHPDQGKFTVNATFLIDATGRQANVCRQIGVSSKKLDNLMGVGAFLRFGDEKTLKLDQLLETTELGWWYYAVLPNKIMAVIFFSDADIISKYRLNKSTNWNKLLLDTKQMKGRVKGASTLAANPWVRNAFTQISNTTECENFLAIGDAATAFDPISSMGIGFAITSACQAATIVQSELSDHNPERIAVYQQDVISNFESYMKLRKYFYQQEKRWASSDFWMRRH